ncbi:MAG: T9SS type A sorting domain-containing protein [bacterium]|nr:T9SS type A sorting domain-containing protein [bacterium]
MMRIYLRASRKIKYTIGFAPLLSITLLMPLGLFAQNYVDATNQMPAAFTSGATMDVESADLDGDGDLDLVLAGEALENLIFFNDGSGHFTLDPERMLPEYDTLDNFLGEDSEDIGIADFDGDGDLDLLFVSEDTPNHELLLNDGSGKFVFANYTFPQSIGNAVLVMDINADGSPDIIIGNKGNNTVLINDGGANFSNETVDRWPNNADGTQDLKAFDIDNDGDLDVFEGAESGGSNVYLNEGGIFTEANERLPIWPFAMETRKVSLLDANGDGDTDVYLSNVGWSPLAAGIDRLLLNDGNGFFEDVTTSNLPGNITNETTLEALPLDFDQDGDTDLILTQWSVPGSRAYHVLLNDGNAKFAVAPESVLPQANFTQGTGVHANDFNGDGIADLYLANYNQQDYLFFSEVASAIGATGGQAEADFKVFPIPVQEVLHFAVGSPGQVQVFDAAGQLKWAGQIGQTGELDVSRWASGTYWARYHTNAVATEPRSFVKE